jgi:hypothetical protein
MNWQKCLIPSIIIFIILAFLGYLALSIFIVPINATCEYISSVPPDSPVDLSLNDWIYANMITGIVFFSLLVSLSKEKNPDSACVMGFFFVFTSLYCLFEVVWAVIGFLIFDQNMKDACSYADSFNTVVTA